MCGAGVPLGSIFGPLIFTFFTNNLTSFVTKCKIHMYADDTQLYYSFPLSDIALANTVMNGDLRALASVMHYLSLNPGKTVMLVFWQKKDF